MSSKQTTRKRGRINVVACNKCKRDKKRCDGSYLTQKPCKYCRDRNECCEYTEPNRLRLNKTNSGDVGECGIMTVSSSNINDIINECENLSNQRQDNDSPLQQKLVGNEMYKSDLFFQLLTDPSTTNDQMIILKRLYNEIMRNPEDPKFNGNKRDELCMKLKLLSSSNDNDDHTKIQVWDDLCSLVNELDKMISSNCEGNGSTTLLNSFFENFSSWNSSEPLGFSPLTSNEFNSDSTTIRGIESNPTFSNDLTGQPKNNQDKPPVSNVSTISNSRKNLNVGESKKTISKKRKNRKNQKGNKRTQPYPAGGQIVIRPTKQAHTMIWHQNDPLDDVPIMAFQVQPPTPPTPTTPPPAPLAQRTQFQQSQPSFSQFQTMIPPIPVNLWDHSTSMTMLSPKPSSPYSESEVNNEETLPTTNNILLSPTPSLHDDIASSPSDSSVDHTRMISDDEKEHFGLISLTQSTGSPQSPSLFTMEEFISMWSNSSSVTTEDLTTVVEPIWNCGSS